MPAPSFYWYDYETFGIDPRRDRPAQFAGIRTDVDLHPIADPLVLYCKPAPDYLPAPEACLLTGITPQKALQEGVCEAEFISAVQAEFSVPGTCVVGYNNLRFDDEVTRFCLYRNLHDPYAREWRNGNSRWDLIDMVRLARALRPEGLQWPVDEQGRPTFKLDRLTLANGIFHADAHDALGDVRATIEIARLVRDRQPKLYEFVLNHRSKIKAAELLGLGTLQPVLHVSEKFPAAKCCLAVVVALARHPRNPNGVVVYDLSADPAPLLTLAADELRMRLFTPVADLLDGAERLPLKVVHLNKSPVLAPMKALRPWDIERLAIDLPLCNRHLDVLKRSPGVPKKVLEILSTGPVGSPETDPDLMLYEGGFLGDADRAMLDRLRSLGPWELSRARPGFADPRLPEMLFRYRARNYPETLNAEERARWESFRIKRLTVPGNGASLVREAYEQTLRELEAIPNLTARQKEITESLWSYLREIIP